MPTAPRTIGRKKGSRPKRRHTSAQRGYGYRWQKRTAQWIQEQAAQGNVTCHLCGIPLTGNRSSIHVDHVTPPSSVAEVGTPRYQAAFWNEENWALACGRCNSAKRDRT